ncbi:MAG: DUF6473 family protein [Paracoccaceae bacterium]|jgi:hypothetical protein|nr:DUF6473 family protein [Paracoccaceae bacterium]MDP5366268.1 DUF6473 family protein [Paracoccaceae bacterium]
MTYDATGQGGLNYFPCRYGRSRLQFRGPRRRLGGDYALFLGGTETYGRFIAKPFPALVEDATGLKCVNFGWQNAGVDAFLNDATVMEIANQSRVTVVQVMGAQNMSNRFYAVHPRRNDRFLNASGLMKQMFRDVDFTDFAFNRHMLSSIRQLSPDRYRMIREELKQAWLARMRHLLQGIGGRTVLLWFADHEPLCGDPLDQDLGQAQGDDLGRDPLFVDRSMIEDLRPLVTQVVEVAASPQALARGTEGMVFSPLEAPAAAGLMGPAAHQEVAEVLAPLLQAMMGGRIKP